MVDGLNWHCVAGKLRSTEHTMGSEYLILVAPCIRLLMDNQALAPEVANLRHNQGPGIGVSHHSVASQNNYLRFLWTNLKSLCDMDNIKDSVDSESNPVDLRIRVAVVTVAIVIDKMAAVDAIVHDLVLEEFSHPVTQGFRWLESIVHFFATCTALGVGAEENLDTIHEVVENLDMVIKILVNVAEVLSCFQVV